LPPLPLAYEKFKLTTIALARWAMSTMDLGMLHFHVRVDVDVDVDVDIDIDI
jgi:hypothetical protein